ncbi:hypothetical protein PENTCL1PPCAC_5513, partial [Pristionchus entomophagus]
PGQILMLLNARDYSRYIYFTDRLRRIFTLDTEAMEFKQTLTFGGGLEIINIATVFDGMMIVKGVRNSDYCAFAAEFPEGYYTISDDSRPCWAEVTRKMFFDGVRAGIFNRP